MIPIYVFSLHFTPLGISFSPFLPQPFAFLVLETIDIGRNQWLKVSTCWIVQNKCSLKTKLFYQR